MSHQSLASLAPGTGGEVRFVGGRRAYRRRLLELGFVPGTHLSVVRRLELGQVLEVELRESRVSLRIAEARGIEVDAHDACGPSGACGSGCGAAPTAPRS